MRLDRKPTLAYDAQGLHNRRRRDASEGFALENLDALVSFTDLDDERWFSVVHIAIEAAAGGALVAAGDATGTGGTDFMPFLGTVRDETADTGL